MTLWERTKKGEALLPAQALPGRSRKAGSPAGWGSWGQPTVSLEPPLLSKGQALETPHWDGTKPQEDSAGLWWATSVGFQDLSLRGTL